MDRIPPHNNYAERAVLGAAMLSEEAALEVINCLTQEDFYFGTHREIFDAIKSLQKFNKTADLLTVGDELKKRGSLEKAGGRGYLATLTSDVPSVVNVKGYIEIVKNNGELRALINAANRLETLGYEGKKSSLDVLDEAESLIFSLSKSRQTHSVAKISDIVYANMEIISKKADMKGQTTGVPSGLIDLDKKLSGFQPSDMIVLAARPSMGKTAFALNVALHAALKAKANILIFSLEMSKEQLGQRLIAMDAMVDSQKMNTGELEISDWEQIGITAERLSKSNIMIDDTPGIKLMEIKNKCRRIKAEQGLDLIILDYLQLMDSEKNTESRQQEITALSRGLKLLAREVECPIIVLSQLSRSPEQRKDHRPMLSDLRESGAIEQDADVVIFLYREDFYDQENEDIKGVCEVNVAKHRNGPIGTVLVRWQSQYTKFVNYQ